MAAASIAAADRTGVPGRMAAGRAATASRKPDVPTPRMTDFMEAILSAHAAGDE
jgi:hypothetical protein